MYYHPSPPDDETVPLKVPDIEIIHTSPFSTSPVNSEDTDTAIVQEDKYSEADPIKDINQAKTCNQLVLEEQGREDQEIESEEVRTEDVMFGRVSIDLLEGHQFELPALSANPGTDNANLIIRGIRGWD